MFSLAYKKALEATMQSPLSLCDRLDLVPTPAQQKMLSRFDACVKGLEHTRHAMFKRVDFLEGDSFEAARAAAVCAMWRLLVSKGSSCVVLAPARYPSVEFMDFLGKVVRSRSNDLTYICDFPRWNVLKLGGVNGWELRLMPNLPAIVREESSRALISIELCAGDSSVEFTESCKALEEANKNEKNVLIRVW